MKAIRYLAPMRALGKGDSSAGIMYSGNSVLAKTTQDQENWPRFRSADAKGFAKDHLTLPEVWWKGGREIIFAF